MSDLAIGAGRGGAAPLIGRRTLALLLIVGILGFAGMLVLGAFAPDLRSGRNGGAHALSNAAVGYSGLIRLAEATGRNPGVVRNDKLLGGENLVVMTPEKAATVVTQALAARGEHPTLMVLPKWATAADPGHRGWVRSAGLLPASEPHGVLAPGTRLSITRHRSGGAPLIMAEPALGHLSFRAPRPVQVITASEPIPYKVDGVTRYAGQLRPLIVDAQGGVVLGQLDGRAYYVLADPDLLSNIGMRRAGQAASALALLDALNRDDADGVEFDVTLNGLGRSLSPLKLAFEPPFLAMTLAVAVTLLLAGLQTVTRFGAPRPRPRAIAFGKAALVDNTAMLVKKAGREDRLGGRYAEVIREAAVRAFRIPARLRGAALDQHLDKLGRKRRFTELATATQDAQGAGEVLAAAQALHRWMGETKA